MKPSPDQLRRRLPDVDPRLIDHHLERVEPAYFQRFSFDEIAEHVEVLAMLTNEHPVRVLLSAPDRDHVSVTVLALDYPSEFSLITGLMAGMGLSIRRGEVFTYQRPAASSARHLQPTRARRRSSMRRVPRKAPADPLLQRRIIDYFEGSLDPSAELDTFVERFPGQLEQIIRLLADGKPDTDAEARHRVNEMVTQQLGRLHTDTEPVLYPVHIDLDASGSDRTKLSIVAQDTPAFLYSLSNALSLMGMSIERVHIETTGDQVSDEIEFVDAKGRPVTDEPTLDRVKMAVLFTKQFTYFLDHSPDPYTALARFEQMVEDVLRQEESSDWLSILADPRSMQRLARLLGASDYLWEEFIRLQYEQLKPILGPEADAEPIAGSRAAMSKQLNDALAEVKTPSEKRQALNRFKDREVFRIDLDHILRSDIDFRTFAERLTDLAELVIDAAARLAYDSLTEQYGTPRISDGQPVPWAIFGLGKLGGAALGYASDIELMFVYDGTGHTDGGESIHVGEFYNLFAREVNNSIEAKQEGIFRVDLRLRPYGANAPLAVSRETFESYYAPGGDAQAFERMALVRLRPVAGDEQLGKAIQTARDHIVYESESIDLEPLWEMRRLQYKQKKGERFNAKYSPGGLVDIEYAVQIMQVQYGGQYPSLRTSRIHKALPALDEVGALDQRDADRLSRCYDFFRQLINGLRMLRGSAKDLVVPDPASPAFRYLARRMGYEGDDRMGPDQQLHLDLELHAALARGFITCRFGRDALPSPTYGTVADVVLCPDLAHEHREALLRRAGFDNPDQAAAQLDTIRAATDDLDGLAWLIVLATEVLGADRRWLNDWARIADEDPDRLFDRIEAQLLPQSTPDRA